MYYKPTINKQLLFNKNETCKIYYFSNDSLSVTLKTVLRLLPEPCRTWHFINITTNFHRSNSLKLSGHSDTSLSFLNLSESSTSFHIYRDYTFSQSVSCEEAITYSQLLSVSAASASKRLSALVLLRCSENMKSPLLLCVYLWLLHAVQFS